MKRLVSMVLAAATIFSTASVALAEDNVSKAVYGAPRCEVGVKLGNKKCRPVDVPEQYFAAAAIVRMVESGLMVGYEDGSFRPNRTMTEAEALTVMLRFLGLKPEEASAGQHWASGIISQAASLGLTSANTDPDAPMTRVGVAILIAKALKIEPNNAKDKVPFNDISGLDEQTQALLAALYKAGLFAGYADGSFAPDSPLSRAEMAILLDRVLTKFKS